MPFKQRFWRVADGELREHVLDSHMPPADDRLVTVDIQVVRDPARQVIDTECVRATERTSPSRSEWHSGSRLFSVTSMNPIDLPNSDWYQKREGVSASAS